MKQTMILTGEINLLGVTDPDVPFVRVADTLRQADVVFANLECCLYEPPEERVLEEFGVDGFYAPRKSGLALKNGGFNIVGVANNQNYGTEAIESSLACLDELGILHTGAGPNRDAARAPVIVDRNKVRFGFIQRTSHYWPRKHEAGSRTTGVAILKAHTAYQPPFDDNKPGSPPRVVTWADAQYLADFREDLSSLRQRADVVVSSHHWGLGWKEDVLDYQVEIAHAAIDAGADIVIGHGPHLQCGIEVYKDRPIFYGLCAFSFGRSNKKKHGDWVGQMVRVTLDDDKVSKVAYSPVRHNERNETLIRSAQDEREAIEHVIALSRRFGTKLKVSGDEVIVWQKAEV